MVGTDGEIGAEAAPSNSRNGITLANNNLSAAAMQQGGSIPFASSGPSDGQSAFATSNSNSKPLTRITATPVRRAMILMNCDEDPPDTDSSQFAAATTRSSAYALANGRLLSYGNKNDLRIPPLAPSTTTTANPAGAVSTPNTGTPLTSSAAPSTNKFLSTKSSSLSAFNVSLTTTTNVQLSHSVRDNLQMANLDELDECMRLKLIQQMFGSDIDKIQAAAIIIQRAFRKHQICKRFRMITDQLRFACKSSPSPTTNNNNKVARYLKPSSDYSDSDYQSTRQSSRTTSDKNSSTESVVPYVSGATRAAAWESLSQAASRLAASAAAASASTNQALSNEVAKSASCQQVATMASGGQQQNLSKVGAVSTTVVSSGNNSERSQVQLKSNSVVAAAINFQQLESIRKRQYRVGLNIFNKSPEKGVSFLIAHSFIDCSPPYTKSSTSYYLSNQLHFLDKQHLTAQQQSIQPNNNLVIGVNATNPTTNLAKSSSQQLNCRLCFEEENLKRNIAHFLLHRKGLAKEKIGQYMGNLQSQFIQDVLVYYLQELDFHGLQVDIALRKFSTALRMPGEAQKIERFVDRFATRYVQCQQQQQSQLIQGSQDYISSTKNEHLGGNTGKHANTYNGSHQPVSNNLDKNNLTLLTKDEIFILTFAIIMLNTDLHSPSLKSTSRMSANQFINNLRGVFKSQTINESDLIEIYERVKSNQITTTPDHVTHVMKVQQGLTTNNFQKKELPNLCVPHRRLVCFCRLFEVYDINKKERVGQHQREIFLFNDILLVTKLARRARANTPQQYNYRQSIPLQGLSVQLFQSAHYNFGIKLSHRSNDTSSLVMFNARNELDRSRFVDDLNESIAEMDEMEVIRTHNIVETIHFKQQDRLRRHALMHKPNGSELKVVAGSARMMIDEKIMEGIENDEGDSTLGSNVTVIQKGSHRLPSKFSSMSNLASVVETKDENETTTNELAGGVKAGNDDGVNGGLRPNGSIVHQMIEANSQRGPLRGINHQNLITSNGLIVHRSCSANSVHSLDSGLFLSRDVSPNQSG